MSFKILEKRNKTKKNLFFMKISNCEAGYLLQNNNFEEIEKRMRNGSFFEMDKNVKKLYYTQFLEFVCEFSTVETLQWLICKKYILSIDDDLVHISIEKGRLDILKILLPHLNLSTSRNCAQKLLIVTRLARQTEIYEWLYKTYPICRIVDPGEYVLTTKEDVQVFKWLYEQKYIYKFSPGNVIDPIFFFEEKEAIEFLSWIRSNDPEFKFQQSALKDAIEHDKFEVLKWLHSNCTEYQYSPDVVRNLFVAAAKMGNLHVLTWLSENMPSDPEQRQTITLVIHEAIEVEHIHVLYWVLDKYGKEAFEFFIVEIMYMRISPTRKWLQNNVL